MNPLLSALSLYDLIRVSLCIVLFHNTVIGVKEYILTYLRDRRERPYNSNLTRVIRVCTYCGHDALAHDYSGCVSLDCHCSRTRLALLGNYKDLKDGLE